MRNTKVATKSYSSVDNKVYNPVTNTYYEVKIQSTPAGKKGTIVGKYSRKKK